jgi:hypothetical protein
MAASVQVARFLKSLGDLNVKRAPGLMRLNHYGLIAPELFEQRQLVLNAPVLDEVAVLHATKAERLEIDVLAIAFRVLELSGEVPVELGLSLKGSRFSFENGCCEDTASPQQALRLLTAPSSPGHIE